MERTVSFKDFKYNVGGVLLKKQESAIKGTDTKCVNSSLPAIYNFCTIV